LPRIIQIRKHDLAITLQKVEPHPHPKVALEQYTIPADLASEILFTACYVHDDIQGKRVLDLGMGTGRLALGAAILGADSVVGIDVDRSSLEVASTAGKSFGVGVDLVLGDIGTIRGSFDTTLMNPPFGTKVAHADLRFLECALKLANTVYSIHKTSTRKFLEAWLDERNLSYERIMATRMEIPHQFRFHRKERRWVEVDAVRVKSPTRLTTDT
jgi:putative methylase